MLMGKSNKHNIKELSESTNSRLCCTTDLFAFKPMCLMILELTHLASQIVSKSSLSCMNAKIDNALST